jgi:branched-chain amino acid transport system ATP-binding protein
MSALEVQSEQGSTALLRVSDVTIEREGLPIVRNVSLEVQAGSITVLLGVNGAGKTTLIEGISGAIPVASGSITLSGTEIRKLRPYRRAKLGLAHVEQGRSVFAELTTDENLRVAAGDRDIERVFELFPELKQRRTVHAGLLSGGEQQMLVVARAMLQEPRVLMLDELSLGLAPLVVLRLMEAVKRLRDEGIAILMVEQFAALALEVGSRACILRSGEVVYNGDCATLRESEGLLHQLYLGDLDAAEASAA